MLTVLHVEDDDSKARAVERIMRRCDRPVRIVRARTLAETRLELVSEDIDAVITDWCFPADDHTGPEEGQGAKVVGWATMLKLPTIVISGSTRPAEPTSYEPAIWVDASGWFAAIRALLARVPTHYPDD